MDSLFAFFFSSFSPLLLTNITRTFLEMDTVAIQTAVLTTRVLPSPLPPPFFEKNNTITYTTLYYFSQANTRMIQIQYELTRRCIELLNLPEDIGMAHLLDIGCGSGEYLVSRS